MELLPDRDLLIDVRRAVHRRPELAFAEHATTALIRERARAIGLTELSCPTETGAVFELRGGRPGASVLLRADIDALPVTEEVDVAWRSEIDGVMHACGHDGHVAMVLGAAAALGARAEELPGRYVFLFQPAEELGDGAGRMIDGGVLDTIAADRMLSIHLSSLVPVGRVVARPGVAMSACQQLRVELRGAGGHGATAGSTGNVLLGVAELAGRLPGLIEDLEFEEAQCVSSAGLLRAGAAPNVVPRTATLMGTMRTYTDDQAAEARTRLKRLLEEISATYEVETELELPSLIPAVRNDPAMTAALHTTAWRLLGKDALVVAPPVGPSDDVSRFLARIPGCHFHVGARPGPRIPPQHHTANFSIDEEALPIGARLLAETAAALAEPEA